MFYRVLLRVNNFFYLSQRIFYWANKKIEMTLQSCSFKWTDGEQKKITNWEKKLGFFFVITTFLIQLSLFFWGGGRTSIDRIVRHIQGLNKKIKYWWLANEKSNLVKYYRKSYNNSLICGRIVFLLEVGNRGREVATKGGGPRGGVATIMDRSGVGCIVNIGKIGSLWEGEKKEREGSREVHVRIKDIGKCILNLLVVFQIVGLSKVNIYTPWIWIVI